MALARCSLCRCMRLDHDLHIHTYLSSCCGAKEEQRPGKILRLAEAMELKAVGFADHVWVNPAIAPSGWYRSQDASQIRRLREDLETIPTRLRVLVGCEAETVAPGRFGITPEFAATLDFVLLSCTHFHMTDFVAQPASDRPEDVARHMLAFFRAAATSGLATAIAHPFKPFGYLAQYEAAIAAIPDAEFLEVLGPAAERGVALEVTTSSLPPVGRPSEPGAPTWSLETPARVLSLARQAGCRFTLGTDAHEPAHQRQLPRLGALVAAAGIEEKDLLPLAR